MHILILWKNNSGHYSSKVWGWVKTLYEICYKIFKIYVILLNFINQRILKNESDSINIKQQKLIWKNQQISNLKWFLKNQLNV